MNTACRGKKLLLKCALRSKMTGYDRKQFMLLRVLVETDYGELGTTLKVGC